LVSPFRRLYTGEASTSVYAVGDEKCHIQNSAV
jgi:hypothetical protein